MRAPPLNKRRHVYLDAKVQKFGFRLEVRIMLCAICCYLNMGTFIVLTDLRSHLREW